MGTQKAQAGGAAGAFTVILVWACGEVGLDIPPEVASAFTTLVAGLFVLLVPNKPKEN